MNETSDPVFIQKTQASYIPNSELSFDFRKAIQQIQAMLWDSLSGVRGSIPRPTHSTFRELEEYPLKVG